MNIGATSMDAPARMAAGALSRSLDVQADAVGKLDDALVLQQKQSASLVGGVGGNGDLLRGAAAAAHQGNGKTAGRNGASAYGRNFFEFHS